MKIADWFMRKNFTSNERFAAVEAMEGNLVHIIQETEKALQIKFVTKYGSFARWIPKSVIQFH